MRRLLEELFRTYHNDVYRYLYSLSHDASLSEDLASEVFLKVVKSIGSFRGEADIKTWLFSIARHEWYEQEPERTRNIVLMRLDGYSFYEIGTKFGISESSARVIDFRTKEKLRKILKKEGFADE